MVGGPAKARDLGALGRVVKVYQSEAKNRGVKVQAYMSNDTPESVINFLKKRLGDENVFKF